MKTMTVDIAENTKDLKDGNKRKTASYKYKNLTL
jgi:hypothetical protein